MFTVNIKTGTSSTNANWIAVVSSVLDSLIIVASLVLVYVKELDEFVLVFIYYYLCNSCIQLTQISISPPLTSTSFASINTPDVNKLSLLNIGITLYKSWLSFSYNVLL